ncbi:aminoacyl-tRNA hydrolase [bacterium CG10_46_32]|nr:MAG: aminoacyl-tRNA hydrolase [bacterium CG10_46_32]PIR56457.1 MAG: aminoacyl-tRNA hydrolase [Parcubacteria group bacterium CG10_big_fil_rev_8_21_14_0_10_46_32]
MKLIIGLGNPGKQYEHTRHNTGFHAVDIVAGKNKWKLVDKFSTEMCETKIGKSKVLLAKPQTFMNNSGLAASKLARFYKIKKEDILIIYDDIDLIVGTLRLRPEGSSGGHQGMTSILQSLKSEKIARLKIGIAEKQGGKQRVSSEAYVLKPPSKAGAEAIKKSLALVTAITEQWIDGVATTTMSA